MGIFCAVAAATIGLSTLAAGQESTNTWKVSFWSGSECHGLGVGEYDGPSTPQLSQPCNAIPDVGYTQSMTYQVASGDYSYIMSVHRTDDCSDNISKYQGVADQPTCIPLDGSETHYSIQTINIISKTRDVEPALEPALPRRGLVRRQRDLMYAALGVSLTSLNSATNWIDKTVTRCSSINADNSNIEQANCGLGITFSVMYSLVSGFAAYGAYHAYRRINTRDLVELDVGYNGPATSLGEMYARMASIGYEHHNEEDGYRTIVEALGSKRADDGTWATFAINHTNADTGDSIYTTLHHNTDTNQHVLGSINSSGRGDDALDHVEKRTAYGYNAWYGWNAGIGNAILSYTRSDVDTLAVNIYNYGKYNNRNQFCALLTGRRASDGYTYNLDNGNYALTTGSFTDQSNDC